MPDSLYSALIVDAGGDYQDYNAQWRLFDYARSQPVIGTDIRATAAHTNLLRPGYTGLPVNNSMVVTHWRAMTNLKISEPLMDWASEVPVTFMYNNKPYAQLPLLDLLMARSFVHSDDDDHGYAARPQRQTIGVWMRENLSFGVELSSSAKAMNKLQSYLVEHTNSGRMILWIYLEGQYTRSAM